MSKHEAVGGKLITPVTITLALLALVSLILLAIRFIYGLGAVTNLNDGYTWGIWVVVDVVIGTAFACGGFAMATLVYIFNRGQYHPLVRSALLASTFGYTLGGVAVIFDLGRWWNFWHIIWPTYAHPDSVMFEVAGCVILYIIVMWIEFSPAFLEKFGFNNIRKTLNRAMFFFIALGVLLPSMHQSSLGTMMVVFGDMIHPLWQTVMLPMLFLISAFTMGLSVVIFEASLSTVGFERPRETRILGQMSFVITGLLIVFTIIRFGDIFYRGVFHEVIDGDFLCLMFLLETALFLIPAIILAKEVNRKNSRQLFIAAVCMLSAGSLYRIDTMLVAFNPGDHYSYFPSIPEMLITIGLIAFEILAYIILTRYFPVLHKSEPAKT